MNRRVVVVAAATVLAACASLLGIDEDYVEVGADGGAPPDGSPEAGVVVDGACTGHVCNGVCSSGDGCGGCATATLLCASTRTCVASCGACAESVECWACTPTPRGSCEPSTSAFCHGSSYSHCPCEAGVDTCPGSMHVCAAGVCVNCGQRGADTDGKDCTGGRECAASNRDCHN
jgi:hypothetical protein